MPDLLSEEETRAAFAELYATEVGRVHTPGTEAVRTTVRRRKTVRAVTVVGCAALVVAGGVAVIPNLLGKSGPQNVIGAQPTVEPTDALGWAQLADEALGRGPGEPQWLAHATGPLDSANNDVSYAGRYSAYNLIITCAGAGTVHVKVAVGTNAREADVACGATKKDAADATTELALPVGDTAEHTVAVTVDPDAAALNKAGFAYVLTYS